jgi:hypothetical protein
MTMISLFFVGSRWSEGPGFVVVSLHWILPVVGRCLNGHDPVMISDFRVQISAPLRIMPGW